MAEHKIKTARLEARITPDLQALLKRAAELEGRSVTDFVITAAQEAARRASASDPAFARRSARLRRSNSQPA
jgi:uncharacterized protein (DUF1778 family)